MKNLAMIALAELIISFSSYQIEAQGKFLPQQRIDKKIELLSLINQMTKIKDNNYPKMQSIPTNENGLTYLLDTVLLRSIQLSDTERYSYSYDGKRNMLSCLNEIWKSNKWVNSLQFLFTYDADGNELIQTYQLWKNNAWVNSDLNTYTYDASGQKLIADTYQVWQNNSWVNSSLDTYTYDANQNEITNLTRLWNTNAWINYYLGTYTYDANGNNVTSTFQKWLDSSWVNASQYLQTYDVNGHELTWTLEQWQNNVWLNSILDTLTYDLKGNELTCLEKQWQNGVWVNSNLQTYTYDTNGNELSWLYSTWLNNSWENTYLCSQTYDSNGNISLASEQQWINNSWIPSDGLTALSNSKNSYFGFKVPYYYASFTWGEAQIAGLNSGNRLPANFILSQNYPNPFNPTTTIDYSVPKSSMVTIKVYDVLGKEVATLVNQNKSAGNYSVQFNASSKFASGVYLYRMQARSFVQTKKLILMK